MKKVSCNCVAHESEKCKHVYALIHFLNSYTGASKTSVEQEWGKPSASQIGKEQYSKPLLVTNAFKRKKEILNRIRPYKLQLDDIKRINSPLATVIARENTHEAEIAAGQVMKFLIEQVLFYFFCVHKRDLDLETNKESFFYLNFFGLDNFEQRNYSACFPYFVYKSDSRRLF